MVTDANPRLLVGCRSCITSHISTVGAYFVSKFDCRHIGHRDSAEEDFAVADHLHLIGTAGLHCFAGA